MEGSITSKSESGLTMLLNNIRLTSTNTFLACASLILLACVVFEGLERMSILTISVMSDNVFAFIPGLSCNVISEYTNIKSLSGVGSLLVGLVYILAINGVMVSVLAVL